MLWLAALALPQAALAMPNDPDVIGLDLVHAILPDAFGPAPGCLAPALDPPSQIHRAAPPRWRAAGKGALAPALRTALNRAYFAAQPIPDDIVDADELHATLPQAHFPDTGWPCGTEINFSLPRRAGDWAFIERGSSCGAGCGSGQVIAYRRQKGSWRRLATAVTWSGG